MVENPIFPLMIAEIVGKRVAIIKANSRETVRFVLSFSVLNGIFILAVIVVLLMIVIVVYFIIRMSCRYRGSVFCGWSLFRSESMKNSASDLLGSFEYFHFSLFLTGLLIFANFPQLPQTPTN